MHVFNSTEGKKVLEALEEEFYHGELLGESPDKTAYNLGRRDVVMYIKQMLNYGERNE